MDLPLIQDDKNLLTEEQEDTAQQNEAIENSSVTITTEIAKLLLVDVPFKKKLDPVHVDIFEFEEELRRLNGTSIIQPLQEKGFTISDTSGSLARLYINNERLIILRKTLTSTESHIIATGTISLTVSSGLSLLKSQAIAIIYNNYDYDNKMQGTITSYDNSLGLLVVKVNTTVGSGTFSSWDIYTEIVNVPLFPVRGYSKSQFAGSNLDIWSRDRFGSTTSSIVDSIFTIDDNNKKLAVRFDGTTDVEIDFSTLLNIEQTNELVQVTGSTATLNNPLVLPTSDTISLSQDITDEVIFELTKSVKTTLTIFDLTKGTEKSATIKIAEPDTSVTISYVLPPKVYPPTLPIEADSSIVMTLVKDTDYSLSDLGVVTFLTTVLANYQMIAIYTSDYQKEPTTATLENSHVISGSDVITMSSDTKGIQELVRGIDYSIDNLSGVIIFLKSVLAGYKMTISYTSGYDYVRGVDYVIEDSSGLITFLTPVDLNYQMTAAYKYQIKINATSVASTIQLLLQQANPSLATCACIFNEGIKTFTIVSPHSKQPSTSSVEVIAATDSDLKTVLGFDDQYMIQGKFQNNLLNVEIDGTEAEIKIQDFRRCFVDSVGGRGSNNDDIGFYWSGDSILGMMGRNKVGPLFCSGINNGKDVAKSIEAQLRMVGSGGFKDATVHYFTKDNTFIIYSGTMGSSSSVHVLAASDLDRDVRTLLGFNPPEEERGHETSYDTLQALYDKLNATTNIEATDLIAPTDRMSHSILYQKVDGIKINSDFQNYDIMTTKIYDDGSRGLPRLYPNGKLVIDDSNNKINFFETADVEKTATIENGTYDNETFVADEIRDALNLVSSGYSCTYNTKTKKFIISKGSTFSLLWQTGRNALNEIGNYIGFDVTADSGPAPIHQSNRQVVFSAQDFFYPAVGNSDTFYYPNQFNGTPRVPDHTVDEQSALLKEEEYLTDESITNNFIDRMKNMSAYDNEVILDSWEQLAALELAKVNQEFIAIRAHRGAYENHISEINTDTQIINKTAAYQNIQLNKTNLDNNAPHARILKSTLNTRQFVPNTNFTEGGSETLKFSVATGSYGRRIYNKFAPLVKYVTESKHVPGKISGFLTTLATYTPEPLSAFNVTNNAVVKTRATVLSTNSGTYDMSLGNTLKMKIDGGSEQTATFDATPGYVESRVDTFDMFVIKTGINDTIDFSEGVSYANTNSLDETYALQDEDQLGISVDGGTVQYATFNTADFVDISNATAAEIVAVLNSDWSSVTASVDGSRIKVTHDTLGAYNFQISDGTGNPNVQLGFSTSLIQGFGLLYVVVPQGVYTGSSLATTIQSLLNSTGTSSYTVDYNSTNVNKFTLTSDGLGGTGIFELLWDTGSHTLNSIGFTLGFDTSDDVGTLAYASDNLVEFSVLTDVNDTFTIEIDGVMSAGNIVISQGNYLVAGLIAEMTTQIVNDPSFDSSDFTITYPANRFRITSGTKGTSSSVDIYEGTNDFLRTVSLDGDVPVHGGGDVGDISAVTVDEVCSVLNLEISYISASNDSNKVRITTFPSEGSTSSIQITGGTCRTIIGFDLLIYYGHDVDSITADFDGTNFKTYLHWSDHTPGSLLDLNIDTTGFDIAYFISEINGHSGYIAKYDNAFLLGRVQEKFKIEDSDTFVISINGAADRTVTFDAKKATSVSGSNACTRIHSGTDKLVLEFSIVIPVTDEQLLVGPAVGGETTFNTDNFPVKTGSSTITLTRSFVPITLIENTNYSVNYNTGEITLNSGLIAGDLDVKINYTYYSSVVSHEITLGDQMTPEEIAAKIQQEVRSLVHSNIEIQSTFSMFTCVYATGNYKLSSGNGGQGVKLRVTGGSAASSLKLGVSNGGTETEGTGDVANNNFVTADEIVSRLSSLTGVIVSNDGGYIKIKSNIDGNTSRIIVKNCALSSKLGFDIGINDDSIVDFTSVNSSTIKTFSDEEIYHAEYSTVRGWQISKGDVEISFYSIDNEYLVERETVVTNRLSFVPTRKSQIGPRVSTINAALIPSLYNPRKDKVRVRLNKKYGSYYKVGEKYAQKDNNDSAVATNNDYINAINDIL